MNLIVEEFRVITSQMRGNFFFEFFYNYFKCISCEELDIVLI